MESNDMNSFIKVFMNFKHLMYGPGPNFYKDKEYISEENRTSFCKSNMAAC